MAPDKEDQEQTAPLIGDPGGRTYYISVPIRPLSGDVPDEHLDRLTLYFTLYGAVFAAVGAIAIVFPLVLGVAVESLLSWLLVLSGAITLMQFLLICGAPGSTAFLLLGALHLGAGLWLLLQTKEDATAVTFVLSAWFLVHGILKLLMAAQLRKITTWPAVLLSAFASIILSFVCLTLSERLGVTLIGLAFGADLGFTGLALLLIALMAFLGKGDRTVTDADAVRDAIVNGGGHAAASA